MKPLFPFAPLLFAFLSGWSCPSPIHAADNSFYNGPRRTEELRAASMEELAAVLSGKNELLFFPAPPRMHSPVIRHGTWEIAAAFMAAKPDESRPFLIRMLDSPIHDTVGNALQVLGRDTGEKLAPFTPKLLPLLRHDSPEVQQGAAAILSHFRDEKVEAALLAVFKLATGPKPGYDERLAGTALEGLTKNALHPERVVEFLLPVLRRKGVSDSFVCHLIDISRPLGRGGEEGTALVAAYCQLLSAAQDGEVSWRAREALAGSDARAVKYLRQGASSKDKIRRELAAGALLEHRDFSPLTELKLTRALLEDASADVRSAAMRALCDRGKAAERFLSVQAAVAEITTRRNPDKRREALGWIFRARGMSSEAAALEELILQANLALPQKMLAWLDDKVMSGMVVYQSSREAGITDDTLPIEQRTETVRNWWRRQLPAKSK